MNHIFICSCEKAEKISQEKIKLLKDELNEEDIAFTLITDLCGTAVETPELLQVFKENDKSLLIGCNERSMEWILHRADVKTCCSNVEFVHIDNFNIEAINKSEYNGISSQISYNNDEWKPWYPVVDYSKCSNCQQCANFCLFGVYKLDDFKILRVENPSNCKDQCPACARVCPEQAIIFPKHKESPIDGGEGSMNVLNNDEILEKIQENDIYSVLSERRNKIKTNLFASDQIEIAKQERKCCSSDNSDEKDNSKPCC